MVVPAFATCTLVPGTHVTGNVTVKRGGTLNVNGVAIGGSLTIFPGVANVCDSTVGGNIRAGGGSLVLGGPNCAGNAVSGNVLVQSEPFKVRVWGNTIGGDLTIEYGTGKIDSIVNNQAANARCIKNKHQTGSGNTATGTNTCPTGH